MKQLSQAAAKQCAKIEVRFDDAEREICAGPLPELGLARRASPSVVKRSPGERSVIPDSEGTQLAGTYATYNPDGSLGGASIPQAGDLAGAITSIANTPLDQPADTQCFRYDYLQRLTEAWTPASAPCSTDPATTGLGGPARYWLQDVR